jgi:hypothetical protein
MKEPHLQVEEAEEAEEPLEHPEKTGQQHEWQLEQPMSERTK